MERTKRTSRKTIERIIVKLLTEHNSSGGLDEEQLLNYTACLAERREEILPYFEYKAVKKGLEDEGRIKLREVPYQAYGGLVKEEERLFLRE